MNSETNVAANATVTTPIAAPAAVATTPVAPAPTPAPAAAAPAATVAGKPAKVRKVFGKKTAVNS